MRKDFFSGLILFLLCYISVHDQTTYPAVWTEFKNTTVNTDNSLSKIEASVGYDASAASQNMIMSATYTIGLTHINGSANGATIDYSVQVLSAMQYVKQKYAACHGCVANNISKESNLDV